MPAGPPDQQQPTPVRPLPLGVVLLLVGLALSLVVGLLWVTGGLRRRTDLLLDTATGTLVSTGPYEFRFTEATAQQRTDFANQVSWQVTVVGEGRTTGDVSIAPDYSGSNGMFVAKEEPSGAIRTATGQQIGSGSTLTARRFTPGLPPEPYAVSFDFGADHRPGSELLFVAYQLEFSDTSLLGDQDPVWNNAERAYRFRLPVRVLPPQLS